MKEKIIKMLEQLKPELNFSTSDNYVDDGMLDSFDVIELISILEDEFDVVIDGMDILPENFVNVEQIELLVKKANKMYRN